MLLPTDRLLPSDAIFDKLKSLDPDAKAWILERSEKIAIRRRASEKGLYGVPGTKLPPKIEFLLDGVQAVFNRLTQKPAFPPSADLSTEERLRWAKVGNDRRLAILEYVSEKNSPLLSILSDQELESLIPLPVTEVELEFRRETLGTRPPQGLFARYKFNRSLS